MPGKIKVVRFDSIVNYILYMKTVELSCVQFVFNIIFIRQSQRGKYLESDNSQLVG